MFTRAQIALFFSLAAASLASANPVFEQRVVARQAAANCARNYTVLLGDTCDSISRCQGVSTFQFAHANPVINSDCTNLALGEPLCLGVTGQDCTNLHIFQIGDTCAGVLASTGLTIDQLRANNPNVDSGCSNLYPGEVLCINSSPIGY